MDEAADELSSSLITTMEHEARIVRHAGLAYSEARGADGLEVVRTALGRYFAWRATAAISRSADGGLVSLVEAWGTAELLALNAQGWGELSVTDAGLRLRVTGSPELRHYESHGVLPFAAIHYGELGRALAHASGLGPLDGPTFSGAELELTIGVPPGPSDDARRPGIEVVGDAGQQLLASTTENRGALLVFLGRGAEEAFGADGEEMYREAVRGFGTERGAAMRLNHLASGLSTDLVNMLERYDSGGNTHVWEYRDEGTLTVQEWSQDCTYCPFVQAWHDLDGLQYGLIYDHEFHYSQFKAYRQDIEVRWGELQSRGDATCEFRFTIPPVAARS